jgi:hypothetical protein
MIKLFHKEVNSTRREQSLDEFFASFEPRPQPIWNKLEQLNEYATGRVLRRHGLTAKTEIKGENQFDFMFEVFLEIQSKECEADWQAEYLASVREGFFEVKKRAEALLRSYSETNGPANTRSLKTRASPELRSHSTELYAADLTDRAIAESW